MPAYSLQEVTLTVGGRIIDGFGENEGVSYKRSNDDWDPVDTSDGATIHNKILSRRGEVTVTLRYDSTGNKILSDAADAADFVTLGISAPNGDEINSAEARIMKRPEPAFGSKTSDYVWVLSCTVLEVEYADGGDA